MKVLPIHNAIVTAFLLRRPCLFLSTSSAMAQSFGKKISCGKDGLYSFHFTCTGPDCSILEGFPVATCTTEGEALTCDNGVTCDEQTALLVSEFTYTQEGEAFYMDRKIRFPHCEFSVATGSNLTEPFFHSDTCGTFTTNTTTIVPSVPVSRREK